MPETHPMPTVGKTAPRFTLPASGGRTISLDDYKGKQVVVMNCEYNH